MNEFPEDLSVAIIAHNAVGHLPAAIGALRGSGCPEDRIAVVDIASDDGTGEWVRNHFPQVTITRLESNEGPNPARNVAIRQSSTPYILLMDSDVRVEAGTIPELHRVIDSDPTVGIASPLVVYADRPDVIQYAGTWLHYLCEAVILWQGKSVAERGSEIAEIGCASGNALMIRREAAIEVGLFDERYFFGKDDGDFTYRLRIAGHRILEVPAAKVLHDAGERSTAWITFQIRNRWHFMLKNYQFDTLILTLPLLLVHEFFQLTMLVLKGHGKAYLRAIPALITMCRGIRTDRRRVRETRRVDDHEVLRADPFAVYEGISRNRWIRAGKSAYDRLIGAYWTFLKNFIF